VRSPERISSLSLRAPYPKHLHPPCTPLSYLPPLSLRLRIAPQRTCLRHLSSPQRSRIDRTGLPAPQVPPQQEQKMHFESGSSSFSFKRWSGHGYPGVKSGSNCSALPFVLALACLLRHGVAPQVEIESKS